MMHVYISFFWRGWVVGMVLLFGGAFAFGQGDSTRGKLDFSGYLEVYYGYDLENQHSHSRPAFMYSFDRHHEFNLNLGMVKVAYTRHRLRSNLAFMAGTYANANLAAEPATLRNVFEANVGFRVGKVRNLWIDAGIFPSHIGFESAIGKDCWNLTRSILADNSPYYESGVKLSYSSPNEKWFLSGMILNGWQHIVRADGNNMPAFGHQVTWKPSGRITLNSSSFVGSDKPDTLRQMRYFHNFYGIFQLSQRWGVTVGFDIGAEGRGRGSSDYNIWYSPVVILRTQVSRRLALAARGEYYIDNHEVIIATGTPSGLQTMGYSANTDVSLLDNLLWRVEGRMFFSKDDIFITPEGDSGLHWGATTSLAVSF